MAVCPVGAYIHVHLASAIDGYTNSSALEYSLEVY